jgi:hypothetical protein
VQHSDWTWICELCYRTIETGDLPDDWTLVFQSAIRPDCQERCTREGIAFGSEKCRGGMFADGPDPRATIHLLW